MDVKDVRPLTPFLFDDHRKLYARYNGKLKKYSGKYFQVILLGKCPEGVKVKFIEDNLVQYTPIYDVFTE